MISRLRSASALSPVPGDLRQRTAAQVVMMGVHLGGEGGVGVTLTAQEAS
jgi:hypothetical protein